MSNHTISKAIKKQNHAITQLSGIQEMLVNDHYIFLDQGLKIINYSKNCVSFSQNILQENIAKGKSLQQLLSKVDEDLSEIAVEDFLIKNIKTETVHFKFKIGNEFLYLQLKKVFFENSIAGYCCLFLTQPLKEEISEVFENMHLMANLSWFTSHKLRGPLTSIISILNQKSFTLLNNETLEELLKQMKHQATNLDEALQTLNGLFNGKEKLTPIIPKLSNIEIKNILMLDDEAMTHIIAKKIIAEINPDISVFSFTDGREALEYIRTFPTDLILLDLNMPLLNGWEFLEAMTKKNINIPTLVVSSSIDVADLNRSFEYIQVKGFINKPVSKQDLKRVLNKHDNF